MSQRKNDRGYETLKHLENINESLLKENCKIVWRYTHRIS